MPPKINLMKTASKNSPFAKILAAWPEARLREAIDRAGPEDVKRALRREQLFPEDLAALLSPAAVPFLEDMAQAAHRLTRQHFGRTIGLYAPIYLSNICHSDCLYCGYALHSGSQGERRTLTPEEIRAECAILAGHGFQNILLLTGEAPKVAPLRSWPRPWPSPGSISPPWPWRFTPWMRRTTAPWWTGAWKGSPSTWRPTTGRPTPRCTAAAASAITTTAWRPWPGPAGPGCGGSVSGRCWASTTGGPTASGWACTPASSKRSAGRAPSPSPSPGCAMRPERFQVQHLPTDRELVQLMLALRLFLPEVGFNLSTRESAGLRDRLLPLGVTMMSAGSSTRPGGYAHLDDDAALEQFEIEDRRSPEEVVAAIRRAGYDPVWKDFDRAFVE